VSRAREAAAVRRHCDCVEVEVVEVEVAMNDSEAAERVSGNGSKKAVIVNRFVQKNRPCLPAATTHCGRSFARCR
jgi:hypothetical protein